jgi:hypothetical protein
MMQLEEFLAAVLAATSLDESLILFLKATALSHWVVDTPWVWPICEMLHFMGLALLIGIIGPLDLRLLGFMKSVPISALKSLVPWAVAGFVINLVTGVMFLTATPEQYLRNLSWWFKVLFLVIAGVNVLLFETTQKSRMLAMGPGDDTPAVFKVIGGVSLASWLMVLYWGRMLPFLGNAF